MLSLLSWRTGTSCLREWNSHGFGYPTAYDDAGPSQALLTPLLNFVPRSVEELDDPFKHEGVEFWLS